MQHGGLLKWFFGVLPGWRITVISL